MPMNKVCTCVYILFLLTVVIIYLIFASAKGTGLLMQNLTMGTDTNSTLLNAVNCSFSDNMQGQAGLGAGLLFIII